jgi:hypothetical protein
MMVPVMSSVWFTVFNRCKAGTWVHRRRNFGGLPCGAARTTAA